MLSGRMLYLFPVAHIPVCFLAYVLWKTLHQMAKAGLATSPAGYSGNWEISPWLT
jgi:hypothetical protein